MSASYTSNQFRVGLRILHDNTPHIILEYKFVKPGKGQAFTRVKLRNLVNGSVIDRTYKSGESVAGAEVVELRLQYLYHSDGQWVFMDPASFEQYSLDAVIVGESKDWLKAGDVCVVNVHEGTPIGFELPKFVDLQVTATDPGVKGDTATGGSKPAVLETGATIRVPLFIGVGELVRVDTRTGAYVSRVK